MKFWNRIQIINFKYSKRDGISYSFIIQTLSINWKRKKQSAWIRNAIKQEANSFNILAVYKLSIHYICFNMQFRLILRPNKLSTKHPKCINCIFNITFNIFCTCNNIWYNSNNIRTNWQSYILSKNEYRQRIKNEWAEIDSIV